MRRHAVQWVTESTGESRQENEIEYFSRLQLSLFTVTSAVQQLWNDSHYSYLEVSE